MFTGIVATTGKVTNLVAKNAKEFKLTIKTTTAFFNHSKLGDSIMIDGVCLTIIEMDGSQIASFEVMIPTFNTTTLGTIKIGQTVNLEPALKVGARIDGHFVLGHVDGTAKLIEKEQVEDTIYLHLQPENKLLMHQIVTKGSIALAGISLTIIDCTSTSFRIGLIPYTIAHTNLQFKKINDALNIETDILAKYIKQVGA